MLHGGDSHNDVMMHHVSENVCHNGDGDGHSKVVMHCVSENVCCYASQ